MNLKVTNSWKQKPPEHYKLENIFSQPPYASRASVSKRSVKKKSSNFSDGG